MKKLGGRIRFFREWRGLSLSDLEKKTGINRGYLSRLEGGEQKNLTYNTIHKIARGIGISISELLEQPPKDSSPPIIKIPTNLDEKDKLFLDSQNGKFMAVPIMKGADFLDRVDQGKNASLEYVLINADYVPKPDLPHKYACFRVDSSDQSMAPTILPNSLVCLDLTQRDPLKLEDKLVLFRENREIFRVRQLRVEGNFVLGIPQNITAYPPIIIPIEEKDAIIGRIVWNWAKIDE